MLAVQRRVSLILVQGKHANGNNDFKVCELHQVLFTVQFGYCTHQVLHTVVQFDFCKHQVLYTDYSHQVLNAVQKEDIQLVCLHQMLYTVQKEYIHLICLFVYIRCFTYCIQEGDNQLLVC